MTPSLLDGWLTAYLAEAVEKSYRENRKITLPLSAGRTGTEGKEDE